MTTVDNMERAIMKDAQIWLPVILFMLAQTGALIWWASHVTSQQSVLIEGQSSLRAEVAAEQLRQWSRINELESSVEEVTADYRAVAVAFDSLKDSVDQLRQDLRDNNSLIRQLLTER